MATYKEFKQDGYKVQVESAIRDGSGKNIENNYAKQDGAYENFYAGNLITDQNWSWVNDFQFGTGTVDTVFDGEAAVRSIRGKTEWTGTIPSHVNVDSNTSVFFNLYNPATGYAHVVESDSDNNGVCVFGTGITASNKLEFASDASFTEDVEELIITEETNSMGEEYLHATIPSDGYVRLLNRNEPEDFCISNVWGGNRVNYHPAYSADIVNIGTSSYFPTGMKSISLNGEEVCYDEMYANKYYARVITNTFSATPSVTYINATGTFNIYRLSLSNALNKGYCFIGGSSKFAWIDAGQITTSTAISANSMSLYTGYIYFAIAQSEDTTYTYSVDSAVVDAESFATELVDKGALYITDGSTYTSVTEYVEGTTYYYISATNLHGLNGKAINDEIASKTIVYQRYSMDKSVYTGTAISPSKDWTYHMGDFGTEELTLSQGFPVIPLWVVYYPINVVETVQQLPNNYVSADSFLTSLNLIGETQGFHADGVEMNEDTGNLQPYYFDVNNNKIPGVLDTKETIVKISSIVYDDLSTSFIICKELNFIPTLYMDLQKFINKVPYILLFNRARNEWHLYAFEGATCYSSGYLYLATYFSKYNGSTIYIDNNGRIRK